MEKKSLQKNGRDLICLLSAAIRSVTPACEDVEGLDMEAVYRAACAHSVQAAVYLALESYIVAHGRDSLPISDALLTAWREERSRSVRRSLIFSAERKKLCDFMDENGIWYMPLKGILLQDLYPKMGMRQMSDNDILFDRTHRAELRSFMEKNGYTVKRYGKPVHDSYVKKPFLHFELHVDLMHDGETTTCEAYRNLPEGLFLLNKERSEYRFTPEDFYVYFVMHAKKHMDCGGVGLRTLADMHLYLKRYEATLDSEIVATALSEVGLTDFEKELCSLSAALFEADRFDPLSLSPQMQERLAFYLRSGTYGSVENQIEQKVSSNEKGSTKVSYLLRRMFPTMEYYEYNYPFLYRNRVFIPFFLIYRFFRGITVKFKKNFRELRLLMKK